MAAPAAQQAPAASAWQEAFFNSKDGIRLYHASIVPPAPRAVVAILHGYADHGGRFRELMERLAANGYAAHALDYRGHGQAGGRRGYVAKFGDYLDDVSAFLERVKQAAGDLPLFVFGHSHGSLILATLMTSAQAPKGLAGLIFGSPYFKLRIEPSKFQLFQAHAVGKLIPFLPIKNPLTGADLTRDPEEQRKADNDPLKHKVVTPRWFTESTAAQAALPAKWSAIDLPVLALQGEADPVVVPTMAAEFVNAVQSKDKKLVIFPGNLHEPLHDVDREKYLGEFVSWLDAHVVAKGA